MLPVALLVLSSFANYQSSYKDYVLAKNQYTQYQTGATRQEAISKTQKILVQRNRLVIEYLQNLSAQFSPDLAIVAKLGSLISELQTWEQTVSAADTIEDINRVAKDWETKLDKISLSSQTARVWIATLKLEGFQGQLQNFTFPDNASKTNFKLYNQRLQTAQDKRNEIEKNTYWSVGDAFTKLKESKAALVSAAQLLYEATRNL